MCKLCPKCSSAMQKVSLFMEVSTGTNKKDTSEYKCTKCSFVESSKNRNEKQVILG